MGLDWRIASLGVALEVGRTLGWLLPQYDMQTLRTTVERFGKPDRLGRGGGQGHGWACPSAHAPRGKGENEKKVDVPPGFGRNEWKVLHP